LGSESASRGKQEVNVNQKKDKNNAPVTITIAGPTGGGKSTAAAILMRQVDFPVVFIDPADSVAEKLGDDAKDIRVIKASDLRLNPYHIPPGKAPSEVLIRTNDRIASSYSLHNSIFLLNSWVDELFKLRGLQKPSRTIRNGPNLQELIELVKKMKVSSYTKFGSLADSLLVVIDAILRATGDIFASDKAMSVEGLTKAKTILEARSISTFSQLHFSFFVSILLDQISDCLEAQGGLRSQARLVFILDEAQTAFGVGASLAHEVLTLRQKGLILVCLAQCANFLDPFILQNAHLFLLVSSQSNIGALADGMNLRSYERAYLSRIPRRHALVWSRIDERYPYPFLVRFPDIEERPYPRNKFADLNLAFAESLFPHTEQDKPAEPELPAPEEKAEPEIDELVDRFAGSAASNPWWGVTEHAKAIGVGKSKFSTIRRKAKAQGLIVEWPKIVDGQGGTKTLIEVTDVWFGAKGKKRPQLKGKGGFPHQYYQHATFDVLKKHDANVRVEIEGRVGEKNADLLVQHEDDGTFTVIEIVTKASKGDNEIPNIFAGLVRNPKIVRKHVIACENSDVLKIVKKDIKATDALEPFLDRIVVIKLTDLWKDPGKFIGK